MEASALTHAGRRTLFTGGSPLLRLHREDRLVAMIRGGHQGAFETLFNRYQPRLLAFCRHMLGSQEDAEDVLQEVFVAAYNAMLGDNREINVRPWLYRIARNRCLNHLRRPTADGQDEMDIHPMENGATTHDKVQSREEFRILMSDVGELPETQRTALLLREIDGMPYEEIARAMETTVPSVKSLLVRARINLAESSKARLLTCDDVRIELAEAVEGLGRASGPARRHIRDCEPCTEFRAQLRSDNRALAALFPIGPLAALQHFLGAKLGGTAGAGGAGAGSAGGGATASGIGAAIGTKAVASVASVALLTAGAVEVKNVAGHDAEKPKAAKTAEAKPAENTDPTAEPTLTTTVTTSATSSATAGDPDSGTAGDTGGATSGSGSGTSGSSSDTTTTTTPTDPPPPTG